MSKSRGRAGYYVAPRSGGDLADIFNLQVPKTSIWDITEAAYTPSHEAMRQATVIYYNASSSKPGSFLDILWTSYATIGEMQILKKQLIRNPAGIPSGIVVADPANGKPVNIITTSVENLNDFKSHGFNAAVRIGAGASLSRDVFLVGVEKKPYQPKVNPWTCIL